MKWTNLYHEWTAPLTITLRRTGEYQRDRISGPPDRWEQGFYDDERVMESVEWRGHRWDSDSMIYTKPNGDSLAGVSLEEFLTYIVNSAEADQEMPPPVEG